MYKERMVLSSNDRRKQGMPFGAIIVSEAGINKYPPPTPTQTFFLQLSGSRIFNIRLFSMIKSKV